MWSRCTRRGRECLRQSTRSELLCHILLAMHTLTSAKSVLCSHWTTCPSHHLRWPVSLTTTFRTGSSTSSHVSAPFPSTRLLLPLNTTAPADDHSRVVLKEVPGVEGSDYINASFIDVSCKQRLKSILHLHVFATGIW